jgi:C-terminal processing protease CtpA/Prc
MKKSFLFLNTFAILTFLLAACGPSTLQPVSVAPTEPPAGTSAMTAVPGATATQTVANDFSSQSYTEAFDNMFEIVRRDYAFNGVTGKQPDWDALNAAIRPRVQQAETDQDAQAYFLALRDFTLVFTDGRVNLGGGDIQVALFQTAIEGGYGFAIRELDDGRVLVTYVTASGPAAGAGILAGAEMTGFDDQPISSALEAVSIWGAPPSTESLMRYQKARYLLRAPLGTSATVTFANPGRESKTVTLAAVKESESFAITSVFLNYNAQSLPVEYKILPSGVGYIKVSSTSDDREKIAALFESALKIFQAAQISGLIIDLRVAVNLTPDSILPPLGLAGFFTDQNIPLGQFQYFNAAAGQFENRGELQTILPKADQYHFAKLVLLIGPGCSNACELEAYALTKLPGLSVVGQSPSAGVLSDVTGGQFLLPDGFSLQIPTGRFVLPDGGILIEGQGIPLTVRVPVDETTVLSAEDVVLNAAIISFQ